jgi:hypothetical protein
MLTKLSSSLELSKLSFPAEKLLSSLSEKDKREKITF